MSNSDITLGTLMEAMKSLEEMGRILISTDKETLRRMAAELKSNPNRSEREDELLGYIEIQISCD